jgi:hypothetical protein
MLSLMLVSGMLAVPPYNASVLPLYFMGSFVTASTPSLTSLANSYNTFFWLAGVTEMWIPSGRCRLDRLHPLSVDKKLDIL